MSGVNDSPLTVLHSARSHSFDRNPFLRELADNTGPAIEHKPFTWRCALFQHYDLFHVHWPEYLVWSSNRSRAVLNSILTCLFLVRLRVSRIRLVRTLHNEHPHDPVPWHAQLLLRLIERREHWKVAMKDDDCRDGRTSLIPHAAYPTCSLEQSDPEPATFISFGLLRGYKGIADILNAFERLDMHGARLLVAGDCSTPKLVSLLKEAHSRDTRISYSTSFLPESDLHAAISQHSVAVLPHAAGNSGSVLLALSLGVPVLVPHSSHNLSLRQEVGTDWVHLFNGVLAPSDLARVAHLPPRRLLEPPRLDARSWAVVGESYRVMYLSVAQSCHPK